MTNKLKARIKHFAVGALIAALGAGSYVIAAVVFSDFTTGTTISASEMNAKLNALKDAVNAASVACPAGTPTRFADNGDGTVCDSQTGLMWEIKTGALGTQVDCSFPSTPPVCADSRNVNNRYTWTATGARDGTLYTVFLAHLNESITASGTTSTCFAGHCDWRIPTISELRSILVLTPCTAPCVAAGFPGPTQASIYWSFSALANVIPPTSAWLASFDAGIVSANSSTFFLFARAVRGGR
jgi:Protein of unknown function (DUF1566)